MKRVSFETAKYLKEIGYSQSDNMYYDSKGKLFLPWDWVEADLYVSAPTYLEVWLWLWREKGIQIDIDYTSISCSIYRYALCCKNLEFIDPEEAIIAAIEYLVEHDLIK